MAYYEKNPDEAAREATPYVAEVSYVQLGHWVTMFDDSGTMRAQVNRYTVLSGSDTNTGGLFYLQNDDMPDSATHNGSAYGMSVHKTTDTDGAVTSIYSGAFTADAELILRFGDGADVTLGGTIDGFEGNAVDSQWTVELERATFTDGDLAGANNDGKTGTTGRDGVWTATAYGPTGKRPTGIFGGFNAHFSDGHAAGVYEAEED